MPLAASLCTAIGKGSCCKMHCLQLMQSVKRNQSIIYVGIFSAKDLFILKAVLPLSAQKPPNSKPQKNCHHPYF